MHFQKLFTPLLVLFISISSIFPVPSYSDTAKIELPVADGGGFIPTLNRFGWMATELDSISNEFLSFSKTQTLPVLDIGTAYGHATLLALKGGAKVIANDIDDRHLSILLESVPPELRGNLTLDNNRFPNQMNFPPQSLSAVLACRLLHFLTGEELELGVRKIYDWLAPGGKVFVFANAPFRKNLSLFLSQYDQRKLKVRYPGIIQDLKTVNAEQADQLPTFFHYLDTDILGRVFTEAGFKVEKVEYIKIDLPEDIKLDGRENVGLIAVKP